MIIHSLSDDSPFDARTERLESDNQRLAAENAALLRAVQTLRGALRTDAIRFSRAAEAMLDGSLRDATDRMVYAEHLRGCATESREALSATAEYAAEQETTT